ncbi:UDP-N-acetylmuramoyl-tripeptide--D-alanyl-D-alanine ligase [Parvularcula marina]|uniref:UDP-N-acetylmuramoyl-tripeptide--D-alanyl-D-alanine ligase n=1 Tax=Parvularcula marina TaxID=2292771 RepID=A0A371RFY3_9PROT|nr:UDP-N-acetylmuramoyl-tripeptide--D-alanyl-D-alanine ligase [Parvularcula marina]RFB04350.1 UDP-N-acetylmuramoyl-tripeptide--D-alanyl-D-alanine ligase [Parvularcula marina]
MSYPLSTSPLWSSHEAAAATGGKLVGEADWQVRGISFDTRTLKPGDLFVALEGARDGHDFLGVAAEKGAGAALVSKVPGDAPAGLPLLQVADTLDGLGALGAAARDRHFGKLVAVTGSVGKTTTKEMLRAALSPFGQVHAAEKSFNNHLGLPASLASMPSDSDFGVFEIGMNHSGEITPLVGLVRPHAAIITAIAPAHLAHFASVDEIAAAKAEILSGLRPGGTAILPSDSHYAGFLTEEARSHGVRHIIPFGETGAAEAGVMLTEYQGYAGGSTVIFQLDGETHDLMLSSPGKHLAMNALAVIAAGHAIGLPIKQVIQGLEKFRAGEGRGAQHKIEVEGGTLTILDEAYNANPASMAAALSVLAGMQPGPGGRRIAVLGEMKELGESAAALHAELAVPIAQARVDQVWLAGKDMTSLKDGLATNMLAGWSEDAAGLEDEIAKDLRAGDIVLFKGSNASGIGAVLASFLAKHVRPE